MSYYPQTGFGEVLVQAGMYALRVLVFVAF